ncbi:MAG: urea ABC transporter permease subunit UrtB, partial [Betaproteobacteria bacterium]
MKRNALALLALFAALVTAAPPASAFNPALITKLATGENEDKVAAIAALLAEGDPAALPVLGAFVDGNVQIAGKQVLLMKGEEASDLLSGKAISPVPAEREDVVLNNRVRRELESAVSALRLLSTVREVRLTAAKALQANAEEPMLPLIRKALAIEKDAEIRGLLSIIEATVQLGSKDRVARLAAVKALAGSTNPATKSLLLGVLEKKGDVFVEDDAEIRIEAQNALKTVESTLALGERLGHIFSGISLGSILLLAALGLAITYGLMGVINMAHGELI